MRRRLGVYSGLITIAILSATLIWQVWGQPYALSQTLNTPRSSYPSLAKHNPTAAWQALAGWLLLWVGYGAGIWLVKRQLSASQRPLLLLIVAGWLAMALPWMNSYPGSSLDIFDYNFRGHMVAHLGVSPLARPPIDVIEDSVYPYLAWRKVVDSYGPVWEYISGATHSIAGDQPSLRATLAVALSAYRGLALLASLGIGLGLWALLRRHGQASLGILLWLWNPLVLYETANGGHNDVLMLGVLLLAFWLLQRGHGVGAVLTLVLAAHIKIIALLLLPPFALWYWRQHGFAAMLKAGLIAAPLAVLGSGLLFAPLGGWATLPRWWQDRDGLVTGSLATWWAMSQSPSPTIDRETFAMAGKLFGLLFGAVVLPVLWVGWRQRSPLALACWAVLITYLLIGSFWFQQWYVLWLLPWAILAQGRWPVRISVAYTFLASGLMYFQGWGSAWLRHSFGPSAVSIVNALPTLLILLATLAWGFVLMKQRSAASHAAAPRHGFRS